MRSRFRSNLSSLARLGCAVCGPAGAGVPAPTNIHVNAKLVATGVTCSDLGVTCFLETSFTTAQGWESSDLEASACSGGQGLDSRQTGFQEGLPLPGQKEVCRRV
jgi:hypothetical protein